LTSFELSVCSFQFEEGNADGANSRSSDREIAYQSKVHIHFYRSYRKLRTEMARQQYPGARKNVKNLFLLLLKTDN